MRISSSGLMAVLSLVSAAAFSPYAVAASAAASDGPPTLLTELLFNSGVSMASAVSVQSATTAGASGWTIGSHAGGEIGVQSVPSPNASGASVDALAGSYPMPAANGADYIWAQYHMASLNAEDVYIEFWAEMPGAKEGFKFVKIFGQALTPGSYADTTFETDYTGVDYGSLRQISFGDGSSSANDTQEVINLNGTRQNLIGRSYGTATVLTPQMSNFSSADWGAGWHRFRIHVKFNSGTAAQNEVPNGEYYLEIDGKVYVDATGLYNRNPANGPIDSIGFFGWAQSDTSAFQVRYYDIRVSTGGFTTNPLPDPPTSVALK